VIALAIHAGVLFGWSKGHAYEQIEYGIEVGEESVEVDLVAALPAEEVVETTEAPPEPEPEVTPPPPEPVPEPPPEPEKPPEMTLPEPPPVQRPATHRRRLPCSKNPNRRRPRPSRPHVSPRSRVMAARQFLEPRARLSDVVLAADHRSPAISATRIPPILRNPASFARRAS
jgi:outer membrane biosynthesis protein TonB